MPAGRVRYTGAEVGSPSRDELMPQGDHEISFEPVFTSPQPRGLRMAQFDAVLSPDRQPTGAVAAHAPEALGESAFLIIYTPLPVRHTVCVYDVSYKECACALCVCVLMGTPGPGLDFNGPLEDQAAAWLPAALEAAPEPTRPYTAPLGPWPITRLVDATPQVRSRATALGAAVAADTHNTTNPKSE